MYCSQCKQECDIIMYDDSFIHELGIEERHHFGSDCCDADVYREICPYCLSKGTIPVLMNKVAHQINGDEPIFEEQPCEECRGIGCLEEVDTSGWTADNLVDWDLIAEENREYDRQTMERMEE